MTIHIEIGKTHKSGKFAIRIGDIEYAKECHLLTKQEIIGKIILALDDLDDGHDLGCEGTMCWCSARERREKRADIK